MGGKQFQVFSDGDTGRMHVLAHRLVDEHRYELGHRVLGEHLEGHRGTGCKEVHLHWHMGVFELALGQWDAAYARFCDQIATASEGGDAATDAPAMLWRLQLDRPDAKNLPWDVARRYATSRLADEDEEFTTLHHLLAIVGSGDTSRVRHWVEARADRHSTLGQLGMGLTAFVDEDYKTAAEALSTSLGSLADIGGSDAQRLLFSRIAGVAARRV